MSEQFTIRIIDGMDDMVGESAGLTGGGGKASKGNTGLLSKIIGGLAGLTVIGQIAIDLLEVVSTTVKNLLAPIKAILQGIVTLLFELIRPITEVVTIILRPILGLIKPLVELFRSFMAPFMEIAREFGRMSQMAAAQGDVGGALDLAIEGIRTLVGPFAIAITGIVLQLVTQTFVSAISGVAQLFLSIILQATGPLLEVFGVNVSEAIATAKGAIAQGTTEVNNAIAEGISTSLEWIQSGLLNQAQEKLENFKAIYDDVVNAVGVETPAAIAEEAKKQAKAIEDSITGNTGMVSIVEQGVKDVDTQIGGFFGAEGTLAINFDAALKTMESSLVSFYDKAASVASKISSLSFGDGGRSSRGLGFYAGGFEVSYGER